MTGEGSEYSRRKREEHREYSDEETDRIVRESIDEVRKEIEGKESSEPLELPEQVYDSERCVREAIEEVQQEEAERLRLKEQKELEDEQQEAKEPGEKPEEYDAERCVREAIAEVRQEEAERQRLREEREHTEMEKEEQLEVSREERKETAEKDDFEEFEERIIENFGEYGIDPEELKEHWRKKFEEEVQDELGEKSGKETQGEEDETSGHEKTVDGHYYYDDGSGQMYEVKMDSKESSGSETESSSDIQEVQETAPPESEQYENTESKRDAGDIESEDVTQPQETEDTIKERSKKREETEQEKSSEVETKEIKQVKEKAIQESTDEFSEQHDTDVKEESPEIQSTREKKSSEESISTPESETKPQSSETEELMESEDSQDAEEKGEEKSESREEEIWWEYEIEHGSLEDEAYKRYLKEVMDALPEEEQERFNKIIKEKVGTIEDFEELARKHGLDELLEDEEVMEEVRNYLKIRSILENEPDIDIEKLAEEMGIDVELAEEWSRGESEPYSLKKLLNLEAFYLWDEILRSHRERNHPRSREELDAIESDSKFKEDRLFQLEQDDAIAFVEIMTMRRRGDIERRIRNGREVYSRKQIMKLSKKYGVSAREIISWLRGISVPNLIDRISRRNRKQESSLDSANNKIEGTFDVPWEITTLTQFQLALLYHNELRFWETFDEQYEKVQNCFSGKLRRKPKILGKLEYLELKRSYELVKGSPLRISIETKQDIEKLQSKYGTLSSKDWEICKKYLEITDNWTLTIEELSSLYGISKAMVNRWRNGSEPPPIAKLRQWEEERILKEWSTLKEFQPMSRTSHISPRVELYNAPKQYRIGKQLEQRVKIIQGLRAKSDVVINTDDVAIGFDSGRIYFWEKSTSLDLIDLYRGSFFYFIDKNKLAQFVMNIKQTQNLNDSSKGLHGTLTHLNKILSQLFPQKHSETYINLRYNRIKGEQLRFLINLSTWSITDLEQSISKIAGVSGREGIANPRFPQGSKLETVLTRIVSIVISDCNLKSNGTITYHEPDIRRIRIVEKYLQALGDIQLKPTYDERTNHYVTYLSAVIGKALIRLGLTPGNKTIHNPGLFPLIFTFSWDTLCALIEELVPQDGSVKPNLIDWGHSHTLYIDTKEAGISFKLLISQEEVDFVKNHGKPYEHYKRLSMGKLEKFTKDKNRSISRIATKLLNNIYQNPNNLIEYEAQIATILGVKIVKKPVSVFYQKRTGAVTVAWVVRTANKIEALRLGMIAPPNDVRKRRVIQKSILDNPDTVDKILAEYAERGIKVRRWWNDE